MTVDVTYLGVTAGGRTRGPGRVYTGPHLTDGRDGLVCRALVLEQEVDVPPRRRVPGAHEYDVGVDERVHHREPVEWGYQLDTHFPHTPVI